MRTYKTAQVHWHLGQMLMPEHMQAMDASLRSERALQQQLGGLPAFGVAELSLSESLLEEGIVAIPSLQVVFPQGALIDVPGNATLAPFSLHLTGLTQVSLHLNLHRTLEPQAGARLYPSDPAHLVRLFYKLSLSLGPGTQDVAETFLLATFEKSLGKSWQLRSELAPPLLQVGRSPFLKPELDAFAQRLERFLARTLHHINDRFLGGDTLASIKSCLREALSLQACLQNLLGELQPHPALLYEDLRRFYVEVCLYRDRMPEPVEPWKHLEPGPRLVRLLERCIRLLTEAEADEHHRLCFLKDGVYQVELPPLVSQPEVECFLLFQKASVTSELSLERLKLASVSRLDLVHRLSLRGIPFQRILRPAFSHPFGAEVEFVALQKGDEWKLALREGALAFLNPVEARLEKVALFWRTP